MSPSADLTRSKAWTQLEDLADQVSGRHLRELFAADPDRGGRFAGEIGGLFVDYSKNLINDAVIAGLLDLAREAGLDEQRRALFAGEPVNTTEHRPALHMALRGAVAPGLEIDGRIVADEVDAALWTMGEMTARIQGSEWTGATGKAITSVVNLGIGGSDLGPRMVCHALRGSADRSIEVRFVSNVDGVAMHEALRDLDPATTLFIVCSKSFGTLETLTNAETARQWIFRSLGESSNVVARHFIAVSSNLEKVVAFGIDRTNVLPMWDWVGGRFSVDSAIGLAVMIAIGPEKYQSFLEGFAEVDRHFAETPLEDNLPVLLGLLDIWYRNFLGASSRAVVPYSDDLALFPAYLQQLEMESNGKSVHIDGSPVAVSTAGVVWGRPGTDGQHAFFQLLHQGTELIPVDLIAVASDRSGHTGHHRQLLANFVAQGQALAFGREDETVAHRTFHGNRPSTSIVLADMSPRTLGQLIAFHEHRTFVQGVLWGINSFDQWGVELGKVLALDVASQLDRGAADGAAAYDSSTAALIRRLRSS